MEKLDTKKMLFVVFSHMLLIIILDSLFHSPLIICIALYTYIPIIGYYVFLIFSKDSEEDFKVAMEYCNDNLPYFFLDDDRFNSIKHLIIKRKNRIYNFTQLGIAFSMLGCFLITCGKPFVNFFFDLIINIICEIVMFILIRHFKESFQKKQMANNLLKISSLLDEIDY